LSNNITNTSSFTDKKLILMFQNGDSTAFEKLFKKYKRPIFSFIFRYCNNTAIASDLTQDVFSKVIQKSASFKNESNFSTWIYTIARNTTIDHNRKAKHRSHLSFDNDNSNGVPLIEIIKNSSPEPDRSLISSNLKIKLHNAIDKLPSDQKEVFLLREYSGLKFDEISKIVNTKTGTVKSRMRYALESLRKTLAEYEQYAKELS